MRQNVYLTTCFEQKPTSVRSLMVKIERGSLETYKKTLETDYL